MANPGRIKCSSKVHKTPVLPTRHQHIPRVVVKRKVGKGDSSFLDEKPHQPAQGYQTDFFSSFFSFPIQLHVISTAVLDDLADYRSKVPTTSANALDDGQKYGVVNTSTSVTTACVRFARL
ncbi:hypothetical protein TNIN_30271 [Trichonephila inaurata madagascariensis]|uniref:Uncharacterized protein n=1 Tax=Trichonephila inaurata madagascariensis TaxID=2747483 RepID=A0A8X7BY77_9ARAC|nr:hypothetical protein TNIN_30271 [Trichonephila inaurata madagascariensis]